MKTDSTDRRVLVVAHRGNVDGSGPGENTLEAIEACAIAGADAVELDVRRTSDGQLVLSHNTVRWRRWRGIRVPGAVIKWSSRHRLPSLDGLDVALHYAIGRGLSVKIDVKYAPAVPLVRSYCRNNGLDPARLALWCRSLTHVADRSNRDVFGEVALLAQRQNAEVYLRDAVRAGATAVSLDPKLLTPHSVAAARKLGLTTYAWIVDPNRHRNAVHLGVDGLVTDWIARAQQDRAIQD